MARVAGPAALALASLPPNQVAFIRNIPKAELHAHLNGCIPIETLLSLAVDYERDSNSSDDNNVGRGLEILRRGVELEEIGDFFDLFPAIYRLTSTTPILRRVTAEVLRMFLDEQEVDGTTVPPECTYLELRTTPRESPHMTRGEYLEAVLCEVERYSPTRAALIVSIDRRMSVLDAERCVDLAVQLKAEGRRLVGIDLCGTPTAGDMNEFLPVLKKATDAGLGLTLHIAEVISKDLVTDTDVLLRAAPQRLGHATFLTKAEIDLIKNKRIVIELCLTSNLLCKTVPSLQDHHIQSYIAQDHPISISTDDTLVFRTSLTAEYALLLAAPPLGLGLSENQVARIAIHSMASRFVA